MANVHHTYKAMGIGQEILFFLYTEPSMGQRKLLRASKFWKLPAQLASIDFSQSFTPEHTIKHAIKGIKTLNVDLVALGIHQFKPGGPLC